MKKVFQKRKKFSVLGVPYPINGKMLKDIKREELQLL
jgi:hypothetical protein